jgi:small-conductance mechanosensitive channel
VHVDENNQPPIEDDNEAIERHEEPLFVHRKQEDLPPPYMDLNGIHNCYYQNQVHALRHDLKLIQKQFNEHKEIVKAAEAERKKLQSLTAHLKPQKDMQAKTNALESTLQSVRFELQNVKGNEAAVYNNINRIDGRVQRIENQRNTTKPTPPAPKQTNEIQDSRDPMWFLKQNIADPGSLLAVQNEL